MNPITATDLQNSYIDATKSNGLISFVTHLREPKVKVKLQDLKSMFDHSDQWIPVKKSGGHKKYRHLVTKVPLEFQGHIHKNENVIDPNIQEQILTQLQTHLNILCNDIFKYQSHNWKNAPNYRHALENYQMINN